APCVARGRRRGARGGRADAPRRARPRARAFPPPRHHTGSQGRGRGFLRATRAGVHRTMTGSNAHTRWWTDGAVGVIVLDNPPMNVLSDDNRRGIREALPGFHDRGAAAVVLTGAGEPPFSRRAHLKEKDEPPPHP